MSEEIQEKQLKTVLIPVDAQPPTFGMIMAIMAISDTYDEVVICVRDNPVLMDTETIIQMLSVVFRLPKFMVISHHQNFEELVEFPQDLPFFNHVASLSDRVHTNLTLKGYGCYLIPRPMGYDESFHRQAWRQSNALDILRSHIKQVPFKKSGKKPAPIAEEG